MIDFHNPRMPDQVHERLSLHVKYAETDAFIDNKMLSTGYCRSLKGYAFANLLEAKLHKRNLRKKLALEAEIELLEADT